MAANKFFIDIDGGKINSLINWKFNPLTTAQRTALGSTLTIAHIGLFVFDKDLLQAFYWGGSSWIVGGSTGSATWGLITGTLSNQIDLQNALNLKYDINNPAGYITLADIPDASSGQTGLLTFTDWNIFNNKISNTGTANRIPFYNTSGNFITENTIQTGTVFGERVIYLYSVSGTIFTQLQAGFIAMSNGTDTFNFGPSGVLLPSSSSFITVGHQIQTDSRVYIGAGSSTISPLTIEAGILLTNTKAGVIENDGTHLYYTPADAGLRYQLDQQGFGSTAGGELSGTYPNPILLNSAVISKVLTGFASGITGVITSSDSIFTAIEKLYGNQKALVTGVSSVSNSDGTLTISPTTGAVIASLNLAHANTWTEAQIIEKDNIAAIPTSGLTIINTTAATSGVGVQLSPSVLQQGRAWASGGVDKSISFQQYVFPFGTSALVSGISGVWRLQNSQNGGAYGTSMQVDVNGRIMANGFAVAGSNGSGFYFGPGIDPTNLSSTFNGFFGQWNSSSGENRLGVGSSIF